MLCFNVLFQCNTFRDHAGTLDLRALDYPYAILAYAYTHFFAIMLEKIGENVWFFLDPSVVAGV